MGDYISIADIAALPKIEQSKTINFQAQQLNLEYKKPVILDELFENPQLKKMIEEGVDVGNRSEAVASVVVKLLKMNYGSGDIAKIICDNPNGIGERFSNDMGRIEADVLRLAQKMQKPEKEQKTAFTLTEFEVTDEDAIPIRPWVLGNLLMRGKITNIIAPAGVGKSSASLACAMSIATNKNLFGIPVIESGAVAVINNEDDVDEMNRRILALKKYHQISDSELKGKLYVQSGEVQQFIIAKRDSESDFKTLIDCHKNDLIDFCKKHNVKAVFVDPFLETHEANENDNREISEVAKMYREVAQKADCAVCIIHHTRKPSNASSSGHAGDMDSARGASSLVSAARIVSTLYNMSDKDADTYGVSDEDRKLYVRFDDAKANLALMSDEPKWYRRESVILSNGDSVGVLAPAPELYNALALKNGCLKELLLNTIKSHEAFEGLRENGKMSRGEFVKAMIESSTYLGKETETRSTLEERAKNLLLGQGIIDIEVKVHMEKKYGKYTVYLKNLEVKPASLPFDAEK